MRKSQLKTLIKSVIREIAEYRYVDLEEMAKGATKAFSRRGKTGKPILQMYAENPENPAFNKSAMFYFDGDKITTSDGMHISPKNATSKKSMKIRNAIELAISQNNDVRNRYESYSGISKETGDQGGNPNVLTDLELKQIIGVSGKSLYQPLQYDEENDGFRGARVEVSTDDGDGFILITKENFRYKLEYVDTNYPVDNDVVSDIDAVISKIKDVRSYTNRDRMEENLRSSIRKLLIKELKSKS